MLKVHQIVTTVYRIIVLLLVGVLLGALIQKYNFTQRLSQWLYVRPTTITVTHWDTQSYVCIDNEGNKWEFSNTDEWRIGDTVYLIMSSCGTENIDDDIIAMETREEHAN